MPTDPGVTAARDAAPGALAVAVDVTSYPSVEAMVTATREWAGRIDILINNAGISEGMTSTWEMPLRPGTGRSRLT